jgi:signal transduction histidine kinase
MPRWAPRLLDLWVAAILTVATQVELWVGPDPLASRTLLAVLYGVGTMAAAWHRVAPMVAVAICLTALAVVPGALDVDPSASFGWLVALLGVLVSAGYHSRRPLLTLALALALVSLSIVVQQGFAIGDLAYGWLILGGAWLAGRAIGSRTLRARLSEERARRAEEEAAWRAAAAVTEERLRIARELHDLTAHSISVMTLHASGVRRLLHPDQAQERAALEAVERTGRESLVEMHRLLGVLRSPADSGQPEPPPGLARVGELFEPVRLAGVEVTVRVVGDVERLPPGLDLAAFRIVQEAVTNVVRHASARRLDCLIQVERAALRVDVVDDGLAAGQLDPDGHGHTGIRERTQMYGGTVEIGPQQGGGFAVKALLPIPRAAEQLPTRAVP